MTQRPINLYAAGYLAEKDTQWWTLPQVLNHYKVELGKFASLHVVGEHPHVLYLVLGIWAKRFPIAQQMGRHFWHGLTKKQRTQPLDRMLGQAMVRAFGCPDSQLTQILNRERLLQDFYTDNGVVKSVVQGRFSYGEGDGESELEYWTTVSCGGCSNHETVREQLGGDTAAEFLAEYGEQLEKLTHKAGPYCYCPRCDQVTRVTVEPATELPESAWECVGEDSRDDWTDYQEHLEGLIQDMLNHLKAKGFPEPSGLYVSGDNLDWRGRSGWTTCKLEGEALAQTMSVNGDFCISNGRLMLHQDGGAELRCVLSHHDVPTGGAMSVMPYWECELNEDEHLNFEGLGIAACMAEVADVMLAGPRREFDYSEADQPFKLVGKDSLATALEDLKKNCDLVGAVEDLEPPALGVALLIESLIERVQRAEAPLNQAKQVRRVLDHYLEHREE